MKKDFAFAITILILIESSILLALQFALNPLLFEKEKTTPEIFVSLKLPEKKGECCPCIPEGDEFIPAEIVEPEE